MIVHNAAEQVRQREEEEKMTRYNEDDLDGWEFQIMRSAFGKFRDPDFVRKLRAEEAKAGWEMLEKFDDNRIRFKRKIDRRSIDAHLERDAYRTSVDIGASGVLWVILGITLVLFGIGAALLAKFSTGPTNWLPLAGSFVVAVSLTVVVLARRASGRRR